MSRRGRAQSFFHWKENEISSHWSGQIWAWMNFWTILPLVLTWAPPRRRMQLLFFIADKPLHDKWCRSESSERGKKGHCVLSFLFETDMKTNEWNQSKCINKSIIRLPFATKKYVLLVYSSSQEGGLQRSPFESPHPNSQRQFAENINYLCK